MFDRAKAIEELNNLMSDELQHDAAFLQSIIQSGFAGLQTMTDAELMQELTDRDVSYLFGETD
jgi:hypothetical protein